MARDTPVQNQPGAENDMPNLVTVVGHGLASSYEITVDGKIAMIDAGDHEGAALISGGAAEGTIDAGVQRFQFSGQMANVQLLDSTGEEVTTSQSTPTVNIEYGHC